MKTLVVAVTMFAMSLCDAKLGASVDPLKCGGLTFTNSIDTKISGDFFPMNAQGSSGRVSHLWERGDERWGAYYMKCDHPEGDTKWTTCPWIIAFQNLTESNPKLVTVAKCINGCKNDTDVWDDTWDDKWSIADPVTGEFTLDSSANNGCCNLKKMPCSDCSQTLCSALLLTGMCPQYSKPSPNNCCFFHRDDIMGLPHCGCKAPERVCDHSTIE